MCYLLRWYKTHNQKTPSTRDIYCWKGQLIILQPTDDATTIQFNDTHINFIAATIMIPKLETVETMINTHFLSHISHY